MNALGLTEPDAHSVDAENEGKVARALRVGTRTLGELLVTAGVVLLLLVVYQLVWTNVQADRAAQSHTDDLHERWAQAPPAGPEFDVPIRNGDAFATLHIPRLGDNYEVPVVQGVSLTNLAEGVGHYPETALPGEVGNFSVAGHRATNGEPFALLDQLRDGDSVIVETATTWYTYKVYAEEIVLPTQIEVILPVPGDEKAKPEKALLTLTTCNPRWASYERLIFHAELEDEQEKSLGPPPSMKAV